MRPNARDITVSADRDRARVRRLRERMLRAEHARHRIFLPDDWSVAEAAASLPERKALALKLLLERMPVFIEEDELIVGGRTVFGKRDPAKKTIDDPSGDISLAPFPRYATEDEKKSFGHEGFSQGHYVPNYPKLMRLGFGGIIKHARARLAAEACPLKRNFLSAVCIAFEGAGTLALRYAELAETKALAASGERKGELLEIASVCRHVAERPPETLHHACQLLWFGHLVGIVETFALLSFGRMDQYFLPFYLDCDKRKARLLLECLLIKLNDQGDARLGMIAYDGMDNVMLGGLRPDGADAANELTFALLDALDNVRLPNPEVGARVHKLSPAPYVRRLCELATSGMSQIAFYNDDAFVPALVGVGFPPEDARDYVLDACQDILIDGKSNFFVAGTINMTGLLLETLEAAKDDITFEEFKADYERRIAERMAGLAESYRARESVAQRDVISPLPFLSGTMDDCVEKGVDLIQGGLRYTDKGVMVSGAPVTAINSLAAIKSVVFDRREAPLSEIREAIKANYEGCESLRSKLLAAPKWGNDDNYVDSLGKEILEFACREILKHRTASGARVLSGVHQPHSVGAGHLFAATPDGRKAGEAVPVTLSPTNGTERRGPTAVMKSVAKIDPMLCQWNNALGMNFHPSTVTGPEGLPKFESLLRTFFRIGGSQLQLNVVSADTLRAAQREPEKYPDLIVRVWGFCGRFVELNKGYQDDVIARTAHGL